MSFAAGFKTKMVFFDTAAVSRIVDKETSRRLSRFGAFVRTRARSSLRYGKTASRPGKPPTVHRRTVRKKFNKKTGKTTAQAVSPLREMLFFGMDLSSRSVVIGPAFSPRHSGLAPRVLEEGGNVKTNNGKTVSLHSRPFMKPAFDKELMQVPSMWQNSIKG